MNIFVQISYSIRTQLMALAGEYIGPVPIIPVESKVGTDPGKSTAVLYNAVDKTVGEPLFRPEMSEFPRGGLLGMKRRRECLQQSQA